MWKKIGLGLTVLLLLAGMGVGVLASYLDWSEPAELANTQAAELPYLAKKPLVRSKILAVVTSTATMTVPTEDGPRTKKAGFELTELARAYAVFTANGFEVDIASPQGGAATYVEDTDDMGPYDYAFLNDQQAMAKVNNTLKIADIAAEEYAALYLVGGKGTMFDFRHNPALQQLIANSWQSGAVVSAVCHGPAALLGVQLADGSQLLSGRQVTGFSNSEELFLIPQAQQVFGTLLEDDLRAAGAIVKTGPDYLQQLVVDGRLISGQNPWSVWAMADAVVLALGVTPAPRELTGEELAVNLLGIYQRQGLAAASEALNALPTVEQARLGRNLLAMHVLVALMQQQWSSAVDIVRLLRQADSLASEA